MAHGERCALRESRHVESIRRLRVAEWPSSILPAHFQLSRGLLLLLLLVWYLVERYGNSLVPAVLEDAVEVVFGAWSQLGRVHKAAGFVAEASVWQRAG
jgi:hypothetical protein